MLVLNTYTESAPWSGHIINSIVAHIDQVDNFEVYTENMNSLLMTFKKHKTGEIESFKNNLLAGIRQESAPDAGAAGRSDRRAARLRETDLARRAVDPLLGNELHRS